MSELRAPSALRRPISRMRSVTLVSIMFMMPMPPTTSEMPATALIIRLKVAMVALSWSIIDCMAVTST